MNKLVLIILLILLIVISLAGLKAYYLHSVPEVKVTNTKTETSTEVRMVHKSIEYDITYEGSWVPIEKEPKIIERVESGNTGNMYHYYMQYR